MHQFYKRFVRDYIRYKDELFCVAHDVIQVIRKEAAEFDPASGGNFYALHIRRGDFQFKVRSTQCPYFKATFSIYEDQL